MKLLAALILIPLQTVLPEELAFRHVAGEIEARARTLGARRAAARVAAITSVFDGLDRNANPRVTMDALVYELRHAH